MPKPNAQAFNTHLEEISSVAGEAPLPLCFWVRQGSMAQKKR